MSTQKYTFEADTSQFSQALTSMKEMANGFAEGLISSLNPVGGAFNAVNFAAGKLKEAFNSLIDDSKKLINESRKFNMPIKELQEMKAACDEAGIAAGSVVRAMKGITKVLIADPSSKKGRMLAAMGLSPQDVAYLEANKASAIIKFKELYNTLDEAGKEKFGLEFAGGGFNQIKPLMEQTNAEALEAQERMFKMTEQQAVSFSGLGDTMRDFGSQVKEFVAPFVPYIGVIVEILSGALTIVIGIFKSAGGAIMPIIDAIGMALNAIVGVIDRIGQGFMWLGNKIGVVSDASKKASEENFSKRESGRDIKQRKLENAFMKDSNRVGDAIDYVGKGLSKTGSNIRKDAMAMGEDIGFTDVGSNKAKAKEDAESARDHLADVRKNNEQEKALADRQLANKRITSEEYNKIMAEHRASEKEAVEDFKKANEHYELYFKDKIDMSDPKKFVDIGAQDKEDKKKFEDAVKLRKVQEDSMKDEERAVALKNDIAQYEEDIVNLGKDKIKNVTKINLAEEESLKKKEELAKLEKKIEDDKEKKALHEKAEQEKLLEMEKKQREEMLEYFEKEEIEKMKKEGATNQQINQRTFEQKMDKLHREGVEADRLNKLAETDPTDKNRQAAQRANEKYNKSFMEANSAANALMYSNVSSTVSAGAKKGMGGGIAVHPMDKLNSTTMKLYEEVKSIGEDLRGDAKSHQLHDAARVSGN